MSSWQWYNDNLAECYEEEDLDDVAMEAYRKAYQILKGGSEHGVSTAMNCKRYIFLRVTEIVHYAIIKKLLIMRWLYKIPTWSDHFIMI